MAVNFHSSSLSNVFMMITYLLETVLSSVSHDSLSQLPEFRKKYFISGQC
jgi:hypothetical protein